MNFVRRLTRFFYFIMAVMICSYVFPYEVLASENSGGWRPVYDLIMMWVNFGIIVFIVVKFGKKPFMDFLTGQKEDLKNEINKIELDKKKADENLAKALKLVDESSTRFATIKERISIEAEKEKQKIIEDAKKQSKSLIKAASKKVENQIDSAKLNFKSELVDKSINLAMKKLPDIITEKDNEKFVANYLSVVSAK